MSDQPFSTCMYVNTTRGIDANIIVVLEITLQILNWTYMYLQNCIVIVTAYTRITVSNVDDMHTSHRIHVSNFLTMMRLNLDSSFI